MTSWSSRDETSTLLTLEGGIIEDRPAIVLKCIQDGVDLNALTPSNGARPLHLALEMCNSQIMQLLIEGGADIEGKNAEGSTPLIAASRHDCVERVELLVELGADLYAQDLDGKTCLHVALEQDCYNVAGYLLVKETHQMRVQLRNGSCLLQHLMLTNDDVLISKLQHCEVDFNGSYPDGTVAVVFALRHCNDNTLKALLQAGADPNSATEDGDFALHEAVKCRKIEAVKLLLKHGADRDRVDKNCLTPIEMAVELFPSPEAIIHCLLTDFMGDDDIGTSRPFENNVDNNSRIFDEEAERNLCCPITRVVMTDPVIAADGHTYERELIEKWIREKGTSPVTRQRMTASTLFPNLAIKQLIDQFSNMNTDSSN